MGVGSAQTTVGSTEPDHIVISMHDFPAPQNGHKNGAPELLNPWQPRSDGGVFLVRGNSTAVGALGVEEDPHDSYLREGVWTIVGHRLPWLLALMLVQSVSGYVVSRYESLIQQHVIIASFLTMLVGGGGNSSGQTVAELVKRLRTGEISTRHFWRVLLKESIVGLLLSLGLGLAAFPRVRFLHRGASNEDALAIALSYTIIIVMANSLGVCITMLLHVWGKAAVGSPPVVQVLVDVIGISLTCAVCSAVFGVVPDS